VSGGDRKAGAPNNFPSVSVEATLEACAWAAAGELRLALVHEPAISRSVTLEADALATVDLLTVPIAPLTEQALLTRIGQSLERGVGGWVVTVNLDILLHFKRDPVARAAYLAADLRVADGMPLVWASHVQGTALPGRVAGATLSESLTRLAAARSWSMSFVGGSPGSAEKAAALLSAAHPGVRIAANSNVTFSHPPTAAQLASCVEMIAAHESHIVLVGLGSPKQELLIQHLRASFPGVWFVGVGGTFRFLAAEIPRAPRIVQQAGLEWLHRLAQEPRRLGKRYVLDDLPLFFQLMSDSARKRVTHWFP
jgi:N-acetylglucosaminyldiphosphoundecaprenol N-acetyl-beta-D-mannosaminyltransferase